jgi:hypothetical protein
MEWYLDSVLMRWQNAWAVMVARMWLSTSVTNPLDSDATDSGYISKGQCPYSFLGTA